MLLPDLNPAFSDQIHSLPEVALSKLRNGELLSGELLKKAADLFPFQVADNQILFSVQNLQDIHSAFPVTKYPSLWSLIEEVTTPGYRLPAAWKTFNPSLKQDMATMAFTLAVVLDVKEQKLASKKRSPLYLPANASQADNLTYLEHYAHAQLATTEPLENFPIKAQMFYLLAEMGLAEQETRCYPSWDIVCISARVVQLIKQGRNPWISTARVTDPAYEGIPRNSDAALKYEPDIPKNVLAFAKKVSALKTECPLWFPEKVEKTPPLFKNIKTFSKFFFEVMPQLLVLSRDHPRSFCKVFPQDKQVFSANLVIDLETKAGLGPSMVLETCSGYTPRKADVQNPSNARKTRRADYYPFHDFLHADQESAAILAKIFSLPIDSNGQLLAPQIITLLEKLRSPGLSLEVMINPDGSVAFVVDTIPVKRLLPVRISPNKFFASLYPTSVIDSGQYPSALNDLAINERYMSKLIAEEAGIDMGLRPKADVDPNSSLPTIRYELRPTWKQVAMADRKPSILGLSEGKKLKDFV